MHIIHTGTCQLLSWTVKLHTGVLGFLLCVFLCISKFLQKAYVKLNNNKSTFHPEKISGENRVEGTCSNQSVYGDCNEFLQEL